jgi:iron complex outermembrane receptor protein
MNTRRWLARTLSLLTGATAIALLGGNHADAQTTAAPAQNAAANEEPLAEIVVTGSLIRRTEIETPSPVQIVTAKDIEQSGYTTMSDVLRNIAANGQGTLSQSFNGAFASGGSGVALRGLTVGGTLTLIDGHRMVGYPLTDDGERNFVDVSSIPFNAVERVEVLKDGASAEYGSDAIAGVVNIILRKTYTGAEFTAEAGDSMYNDGRMGHLSGLWGTGDLASDGYNWWTAVEYRHQGDILVANRSGNWTNLDWTGYGGTNTTPGAGINSNVGFPESITGYLVNPTTPNAQGIYPNGLPGRAFLPGCSASAQAANLCTFNYNGNELAPETSNLNVMSKFTVNLGGNWQSITTASIFQSKADQVGNDGYLGTTNPTAPYPNPVLNIAFPPGGVPTPYQYSVTVPANYPGNPYGTAAPLIWSYPQLDVNNVKTNTYRLVEDLNGTAAGWDVSASFGYMYAIMDQQYSGYMANGLLQQALNNGYILNSPGDGAAAFTPSTGTTDSSYLFYGNVHGSHKLFALPGGDLALAIGAEAYEKKLNDQASPLSLAGVDGTTDAWAIGSQTDTAAFVEFNAPVLSNLEVDASGRYDHYNTSAGSELTPKIGVKYTPVQQLVLRGTFGRGFRAPSIPETNSGLAFNASTTADPVLCPTATNANAPGNFPSQCAVTLTGVQTSGTALKPEVTTDYTFGFIFEPAKAFSIAADYYDIKVGRDIISAFEAGGLGINATTIVRGASQLLPFVNPDGTISQKETPVGLAVYQAFPYINASQTDTNGIDVDFKASFDLGNAGHLGAEFNYTHMLSYTLSAAGVSYQLAGTHGPSGFSGDTGNPKDHAVFSLTWNRGPVSLSGTINYISSFSVIDPSSGQGTCALALEDRFPGQYGGNSFPSGGTFSNSLCTVGSFTDVDFYGRYDFTDKFSVHLSVLNAFNAPPPLDPVTYGGGGGQAYDAALEQAGAVGRFYTVGVSYKF